MIESILAALQIGKVLTAAIVSRSLLEFACTVLINHAGICGALESALSRPKEVGVLSNELEETMGRLLYGTRLEELSEHPQQTNVLKYLQKAAKYCAVNPLPTYNWLCELAHPNVIGNACFWEDSGSRNAEGNVIMMISQNAASIQNTIIVEKVAWALSWSSAQLLGSLTKLQYDLKRLLHSFGIHRK